MAAPSCCWFSLGSSDKISIVKPKMKAKKDKISEDGMYQIYAAYLQNREAISAQKSAMGRFSLFFSVAIITLMGWIFVQKEAPFKFRVFWISVVSLFAFLINVTCYLKIDSLSKDYELKTKVLLGLEKKFTRDKRLLTKEARVGFGKRNTIKKWVDNPEGTAVNLFVLLFGLILCMGCAYCFSK